MPAESPRTLLADEVNVSVLVPFAVGTFIYIAAADLLARVTEPKSASDEVVHTAVSFSAWRSCTRSRWQRVDCLSPGFAARGSVLREFLPHAGELVFQVAQVSL